MLMASSLPIDDPEDPTQQQQQQAQTQQGALVNANRRITEQASSSSH